MPPTTNSKLTLFQDIGNALLKSGNAETYIVAGERFQHAGPFQVGHVLLNYEAERPGNAFEAAVLEYQGTRGGNTVTLADGSTFVIDCAGVVFGVSAAMIGEKQIRLLYRRVDAAALAFDLQPRIAELERQLDRLSATVDVVRRQSTA